MNKETLKKFYLLHEEIGRVERTIFNQEFYEWNWFVWFEKLRENFRDLYEEFDKDEYSLLDYLIQIVDDWLQLFEFKKLTKKEIKSLTNKDWNISIFKRDEKNYPHAIVKFKDIDEAIDYILT